MSSTSKVRVVLLTITAVLLIFNIFQLRTTEQHPKATKLKIVSRNIQPLCSSNNDDLDGPIALSHVTSNKEVLEQELDYVQDGGKWNPAACVTNKKVAVIIASEYSTNKLLRLLRVLHTILKRQRLYYRVFVVEQSGIAPFNRARLFNEGFEQSRYFDTYDCFIFHDVNYIPTNDKNMYDCPSSPRHMVGYLPNSHHKNILADWWYGGAVAVTTEDFIKMNGWSNRFYSWGSEDNDFRARISKAGLQFTRADPAIATYTHSYSAEDEIAYKINYLKKKWEAMPVEEWDGLNSLQASETLVTTEKLYTLVKATFTMSTAHIRLRMLCMKKSCVFK